MKAARDELDRIDDALLALLGQRGRLVAALWEQKRAGGVPVVDADRERAIFARLRARAMGAGLDPDAVEAVFRRVVGETFGVKRVDVTTLGMKPTDYGKRALLALAIMIANVLCSILVVVVYSYAVEPGHDAAFYEAAVLDIAPWSSVVFGMPLFYGVARYCARGRPDRHANAFAIAIVVVYASIDVTALAFAGCTVAQAGIVALSMGTKLAAALLGARSGAARR